MKGSNKDVRVLVACEYSGVVRDNFLRLGYDAWSCDILPTESTGPHYTCDVRKVLDMDWDLIVAPPPCTYLSNSGARHLWITPPKPKQDILYEAKRWEAMVEAGEFFRMFLEHSCRCVAVENPIMHKHARRVVGRSHDQTVQPWFFGDNETKRTAFWLKGLPPLEPTHSTERPENVGRRIHLCPPGPNRGKERSKLEPGLAKAIASQWGHVARKAKEKNA